MSRPDAPSRDKLEAVQGMLAAIAADVYWASEMEKAIENGPLWKSDLEAISPEWAEVCIKTLGLLEHVPLALAQETQKLEESGVLAGYARVGTDLDAFIQKEARRKNSSALTRLMSTSVNRDIKLDEFTRRKRNIGMISEYHLSVLRVALDADSAAKKIGQTLLDTLPSLCTQAMGPAPAEDTSPFSESQPSAWKQRQMDRAVKAADIVAKRLLQALAPESSVGQAKLEKMLQEEQALRQRLDQRLESLMAPVQNALPDLPAAKKVPVKSQWTNPLARFLPPPSPFSAETRKALKSIEKMDALSTNFPVGAEDRLWQAAARLIESSDVLPSTPLPKSGRSLIDHLLPVDFLDTERALLIMKLLDREWPLNPNQCSPGKLMRFSWQTCLLVKENPKLAQKSWRAMARVRQWARVHAVHPYTSPPPEELLQTAARALSEFPAILDGAFPEGDNIFQNVGSVLGALVPPVAFDESLRNPLHLREWQKIMPYLPKEFASKVNLANLRAKQELGAPDQGDAAIFAALEPADQSIFALEMVVAEGGPALKKSAAAPIAPEQTPWLRMVFESEPAQRCYLHANAPQKEWAFVVDDFMRITRRVYEGKYLPHSLLRHAVRTECLDLIRGIAHRHPEGVWHDTKKDNGRAQNEVFFGLIKIRVKKMEGSERDWVDPDYWCRAFKDCRAPYEGVVMEVSPNEPAPKVGRGQDLKIRTALMHACALGSPRWASALIKIGADPAVKQGEHTAATLLASRVARSVLRAAGREIAPPSRITEEKEHVLSRYCKKVVHNMDASNVWDFEAAGFGRIAPRIVAAALEMGDVEHRGADPAIREEAIKGAISRMNGDAFTDMLSWLVEPACAAANPGALKRALDLGVSTGLLSREDDPEKALEIALKKSLSRNYVVAKDEDVSITIGMNTAIMRAMQFTIKRR